MAFSVNSFRPLVVLALMRLHAFLDQRGRQGQVTIALHDGILLAQGDGTLGPRHGLSSSKWTAEVSKRKNPKRKRRKTFPFTFPFSFSFSIPFPCKESYYIPLLAPLPGLRPQLLPAVQFAWRRNESAACRTIRAPGHETATTETSSTEKTTAKHTLLHRPHKSPNAAPASKTDATNTQSCTCPSNAAPSTLSYTLLYN